MDTTKSKQDPRAQAEAVVEDFAQRHVLNHILMEYGPAERRLAREALIQAFCSDAKKGFEKDRGDAGKDSDQEADKDLRRQPAPSAAGACELGDAWTEMVSMSDGVRLATDVLLPRGDGPWPVVLTRTPYNKSVIEYLTFVKAGYAAVHQDSRGRFASEGENIPFIGCGWERHQDGRDTVDWIKAQPWCSGKVATHGGSANAITQNLLAGAVADGLAAQYILSASASLYADSAYTGGAFRLSLMCVWTREVGFHPGALREFRENTSYGGFWRKYDSTLKHAEMNCPAMHVGGWFDIFCQGSIDAFLGRQHHGGEKARGRQVLVMGPWSHGTFDQSDVGELFFPGAQVPEGYRDVDWLPRHLEDGPARSGDPRKGRRRPKSPDRLEPRKPVAYYVMGDVTDPEAPGNTWRFADGWPPEAEEQPFYLHWGDGPDGSLWERRLEGESAPAAYAFDPQAPCLTVGGANLVLPAGPMDQRPVEAREDVLIFSSEPLAKPLEVTGRIRARLFVSSSAKDTDVSVRLCDVYPDGASYLMAEGMLRLRFRDSLKRSSPLELSKVYQVEVDCWSTSVVFNRGHRLRVAVTSSNFPRFDPNPGTGEPWTAGCRRVVQRNSVHCDAEHPSRIVLPVVRRRG
jgi:predicted acyl esterase